jgi:hypothetical protein
MLQKTIGGKMIVGLVNHLLSMIYKTDKKLCAVLRSGRPVGRLAVQSVDWPYSRQNGCGRLLATVWVSK